MGSLAAEVQDFYDGSEPLLFQELVRRVNHDAVGPFFRTKLRRSGRILDAGSGRGNLANELGLNGAYFLDLAWGQISRCRQRRGSGHFIQADLKSIPFQERSFDVVICSNVLHYIGLAGIQELLRVTKKGGQILLTFMEDSDFTRAGIRLGVSMGIFPSLMLNARLVELSAFLRLDVTVKDSRTIAFLPPFFHASRASSRRGLVAFELER